MYSLRAYMLSFTMLFDISKQVWHEPSEQERVIKNWLLDETIGMAQSVPYILIHQNT